MLDIEDTMEKSYRLYRKLKEFDLKEEALTISKNIHEIKKDYARVVAGMEKTLSEEKDIMKIHIKDIFYIIKENTNKLIYMNNKEIFLECIVKNDFIVYDVYPLISVLNNIIINAIEAIELKGKISVYEEKYGEDYIFRIIDNGTGIDKEDKDLLFETGFSTKYDPITGKMSTGIGLSHARQIIENHYGGSIILEDYMPNYTVFKVTIPCKNLKVRMR